ncbi:MAG: hypothetical protein E7262_00260 [Lachnospiraceae bacterium]|nr:hypothetical protein [Lachnospiraceae bacterium]
MKINMNKNFKKNIALALAATIIVGGICGFNAHTKADTPDDFIVKADDYASITRDTSISLNGGELKIERTQKELTPMGAEDSWTIFVYMTGSDLESDYENATKDIKEMFAANYGEDDLSKLNIIIQTGGSTYWHTSDIKSDHVQRFIVTGNKLTLLEEHPSYSMGSGDTLYSFLNWGVKNYPAEHMGFIFWNHGSGVSNGLCVDTVHDYDSLSLGEVEYAFAKVSKKMTDKFELIGFDTCLSGSIEYANILAPYGKYMVASADSEPGDGWNYTPIVNYIVTNPDSTGLEIGVVIADSFTEYYANDEDTAGYTTMAVYDLSKVDKALIETNHFAKYLFEKIQSDDSTFDSFAELLKKCYTYERINLDYGTLFKAMKETSFLGYNVYNFEASINDLVVYNKIGAKFTEKGCNGITLFLPNKGASLSELNMYRNAGFSPYWLDILEYVTAKAKNETLKSYTPNGWSTSPYFFEDTFNFIDYDDTSLYTDDAVALINANPSYLADGFANNWEDMFEAYIPNFPTFTNIPGGFGLEISRNDISATLPSTSNVNGVYSTVFKEVDNKLICLGEYADVNFDNKTGKVNSSFTKNWFMLPDGQLLTTYVISVEDNSVIYGIPVIINDVESTIRIKITTLSNNTAECKLLGVWDATQNSTYAPRGYLPLNPGTSITPIYDVYDLDTETYESEFGEDYTITSDFDFLFTELNDGDYSYALTIDRVLGEDIFTQVANFSISNGQVN